MSFGAGYYDILIAKFNPAGELMWSKVIGGYELDLPQSLIQTSDEGFVITGYTNNFGAETYDILVMKINSLGEVEWVKIIGGESYDQGYTLKQTIDKGYIIGGTTRSFGPNSTNNIIFVKLDSLGNSCMGQDISPIVNSIVPQVMSVIPISVFISPSIRPLDMTSVSASLIETTLCENINIQEYQKLQENKLPIYYLSSIFKDRIRINFVPFSHLPLEISFYNINGSLLFTRYHKHASYKLNILGKEISKLPLGTYFISLKQGNKVLCKIKVSKIDEK